MEDFWSKGHFRQHSGLEWYWYFALLTLSLFEHMHIIRIYYYYHYIEYCICVHMAARSCSPCPPVVWSPNLTRTPKS